MSRTSFSFSSMIWSFVSSSSASGTVSSSTVEPLLERDLVAHPERADEDVHLPLVRVVVEEEPFAAVHRVEAEVRLVADVAQELLQVARRLLRGREVEVLVLARERGRQAARPHVDGDAAEQADRQAGVARGVEDAAALGDDVRRGAQKRPTVLPCSSMSTEWAAGVRP